MHGAIWHWRTRSSRLPVYFLDSRCGSGCSSISSVCGHSGFPSSGDLSYFSFLGVAVFCTFWSNICHGLRAGLKVLSVGKRPFQLYSLAASKWKRQGRLAAPLNIEPNEGAGDVAPVLAPYLTLSHLIVIDSGSGVGEPGIEVAPDIGLRDSTPSLPTTN